MLRRSLFAFGLLLPFCIPAHADSAAVMDGGGCDLLPNPPIRVVAMFQFPVAPPTSRSGASSQCFVTTTTAFHTLDLSFAAPPTSTDITSCTSAFFAICNITEVGDITDIHFAQGTDSGIPTDTVFNIVLEGFTTNQEIDAIANVPEPDPAWTVGFALVTILAVNVWRRRPLQLMRDRTE